MQFIQTPNYQKNSGNKKIGFVLHGTLGGYKGAVDWLLNKDRSNPTSAHVVIGKNEGEITELVKPQDIAWHAGLISNPSARFKAFMPKNTNGTFKSPNQFFIGIEFAWGYDEDHDGTVEASEKVLTPWQYKAAVEYMRYAMKAVGMADPVMFSHHEIASYKADNMLFAIPAIDAALQVAEPIKPPVPEPKPGVSKEDIAAAVKALRDAVDNLLELVQ